LKSGLNVFGIRFPAPTESPSPDTEPRADVVSWFELKINSKMLHGVAVAVNDYSAERAFRGNAERIAATIVMRISQRSEERRYAWENSRFCSSHRMGSS
jgi:hypothetical protein